MATPPHPIPHRMETARLRLRPWSEEDAPAVRDALDASDALLRPWVPFMRHEPQDIDGTRAWCRWRQEQLVAGGHLCYGVFRLDDGVLLGETMLLDRDEADARELGYWTDVRHGRGGVAREAAAAMLHLAFDLLGLARVEAQCAMANEGGQAVVRRLGFARTGTRTAEAPDGAPQPLGIWTLAAEDHESGEAPRCWAADGTRLD